MSLTSAEYASTAPAGSARPLGHLHLFVLATFAISQPVYDRLGDRGVFLANAGFGPAGLLLLSAILSLAIPALAPLSLWCAGRMGFAARSSLHVVLLFTLLSAIALPIVKRFEEALPDWGVVGLSLTAAAIAACGYFCWHRTRLLVTALTPWIVFCPALFLFGSPIKTFFFDPAKIDFSRGEPVPVVMIVLDELCGTELVNAEGEIDELRFPNFAELARGSTWFRNATTVFPDTWQAVPVLLTGSLPRSKYIPRASECPQNLFSILESTGEYQMAVFEPISNLATRRLNVEPAVTKSPVAQVVEVAPVLAHVYMQHLAPLELRSRLPKISLEWFGACFSRPVDRQARRGVFRYNWGANRDQQVEHFIDCLDGDAQPSLHFFHVLLPHVPWCYLPSGRRYMAETAEWELLDFETHSHVANLWGSDELYVAHGQQRQLLQLQFADLLLGRILSRLHETGLHDKCLLIVTADHGISFKVNDLRRGVSPGNRADIMSVPLFIKKPGQRAAAVNDKNVESIDILPTIADVLKFHLPLPVDGKSVFDQMQPERTSKTIYINMMQRESAPATVVNDTAAIELARRFGPSSDPDAFFRVGPRPELVGRAVSDVPSATGPVVEIELIRSGTRYTSRSDDLVPCYHEGWVVSSFDHSEPVCIAVAVNGVIRAVTRTYQLDGIRNRWAAMFPEQALNEGENDIRYYSVTGNARDLRLTECVVRPGTVKPQGGEIR